MTCKLKSQTTQSSCKASDVRNMRNNAREPMSAKSAMERSIARSHCPKVRTPKTQEPRSGMVCWRSQCRWLNENSGDVNSRFRIHRRLVNSSRRLERLEPEAKQNQAAAWGHSKPP